MSHHPESKALDAPPPSATPPRRRLALTWVDWRARVQWFAAEFLIVVTGVLVALAVQAWWVERAGGREQGTSLVSP